MCLGGIAGREQFHDLVDPLTIEFGIVGGFGRSAQELLKLHGETGIVPEGEKRVRFHIHNVFLGLQVSLEHGLASNGSIVSR